MPSAKHSILSTKPLSREQIQQAATHGIAVSEQAFIEVKPVLTEASVKRGLEIFANGSVIVFTSPNAVKIVAEVIVDRSVTGQSSNNVGEKSNAADLSAADDESNAVTSAAAGNASDHRGSNATQPPRIYCIQGSTREAVAQRIPQASIAGTASHSKALAELVLLDNTITSVVFFCGNIRRDELPDTLRGHGVEVEEVIVYETQETPVKLTETYDGILFYSPSSVRSFFSGNTLPAHTACFAIGHTTGAALQAITENKVVISPEPAVDALLQTVILYFDNINSQE